MDEQIRLGRRERRITGTVCACGKAPAGGGMGRSEHRLWRRWAGLDPPDAAKPVHVG